MSRTQYIADAASVKRNMPAVSTHSRRSFSGKINPLVLGRLEATQFIAIILQCRSTDSFSQPFFNWSG